MAIAPIYLRLQRDILARENTLTDKRKLRNFVLDKAKEHKKDKELCAAFKSDAKKVEGEILTLETSLRKDFDTFRSLQKELGEIRLALYIFSDLAYNELIRYESWLKKHALNTDPDTITNLHNAIDAFKQLPFALADAGKANDVYSVVIDSVMDRWEQLRDDLIKPAMEETDRKLNDKNLRLVI